MVIFYVEHEFGELLERNLGNVYRKVLSGICIRFLFNITGYLVIWSVITPHSVFKFWERFQLLDIWIGEICLKLAC